MTTGNAETNAHVYLFKPMLLTFCKYFNIAFYFKLLRLETLFSNNIFS